MAVHTVVHLVRARWLVRLGFGVEVVELGSSEMVVLYHVVTTKVDQSDACLSLQTCQEVGSPSTSCSKIWID